MCVREINFAAFRIRRVVAAHNFPEQIINLVENWRGEERGGKVGRRIRMPRVRSKRRFYDRGAEEEGRGDDDDREKWRVKSDHSLSLSLSRNSVGAQGWRARFFLPFFFRRERSARERGRGREGGERAMTERLIKRSYYFDANILISGEISRYRPVITTRRSDINNGFILIT